MQNFFFYSSMTVKIEVLSVPEDAEDLEHTWSIVCYYYKKWWFSEQNGLSQLNRNQRCMRHSLVELFSDKKRPMLDLVQCAPIRKDDDNWYEELEKMLRKFSTNKWCPAHFNFLESTANYFGFSISCKRTATGELKIVQLKTLDSTIANDYNENGFPFTVADSPKLGHLVEQCIEFGQHWLSSCQQHPGRKYKAQNRRKIAGSHRPLPESAYDDTAA